MKFKYFCEQCNKSYDIIPDVYLCPNCQDLSLDTPIKGVLDVKLEGKIDTNFEVVDLLPISKQFRPSIPVGNTPLWSPHRLANLLGLNNVYIKNDDLNPTGSLKDRASYLVAGFAKEHGINEIVLASTGNAASSMAGVAASLGIKATIFLPKTAPEAKLIQIVQYGAKCILVDGNYDMAYDLSLEYSKKFSGINRNTGYNPLTIEGKKTISLEIYKQLNCKLPEYVFVSAGDGVILSGVYKGFEDLMHLGLTKKIPTIFAIQAEKSAALFNALNSGTFKRISSQTVADSISVDNPRNGYHALNKIKKYNGKIITVSDDEILLAQQQLSANSGIFSEPAGSTAFAGLLKVKNQLEKNSLIVVISTGNGLKDIVSARKKITIPTKAISSIDEI